MLDLKKIVFHSLLEADEDEEEDEELGEEEEILRVDQMIAVELANYHANETRMAEYGFNNA